MDKYDENLVLVFNLDMAYYFIENGVRPKSYPRMHWNTKKIFFLFDRCETKELYGQYRKEHYEQD